MEVRQFHKLANRPDEILPLLAQGLAAIAEHCRALETAAEHSYEAKQYRAAAILRSVAFEEAGKFLILLDAVRLGRADKELLVKQLRRAADHPSKGLYASAIDCRPADLKRLRSILEIERKTFYLDGPNDVDFIFRNSILAEREEAIYVDLVEDEKSLIWHSPARNDEHSVGFTRACVFLVTALEDLGVCDHNALDVIAQIWNGFVPDETTSWTIIREMNDETFQALNSKGLVNPNVNDRSLHFFPDWWTFPLHHEDLSAIKVKKADLVVRRREHLERMEFDYWGSDPET